MTVFINVRGCNGSGKTTLLRSLVKKFTNVTVRSAPALPGEKSVPFTFMGPGRSIAILGDYRPEATGTTAGCDRVRTQDQLKHALVWAKESEWAEIILFEGVVVSTIFGPWEEWAARHGGMTWAFLDTPLETCLARIQQRNGGKPIKEDQVADKHRTIARVREKALTARHEVLDLPWERALSTLSNYIKEELA